MIDQPDDLYLMRDARADERRRRAMTTYEITLHDAGQSGTITIEASTPHEALYRALTESDDCILALLDLFEREFPSSKLNDQRGDEKYFGMGCYYPSGERNALCVGFLSGFALGCWVEAPR